MEQELNAPAFQPSNSVEELTSTKIIDLTQFYGVLMNWNVFPVTNGLCGLVYLLLKHHYLICISCFVSS